MSNAAEITLTGARPAEPLGIRWRVLEFEGNHPTLTINQTVQRVQNSPSNDKRKRGQVIFEDAAKNRGRYRSGQRHHLPTACAADGQCVYVLAEQRSRAAWNDRDLVLPSNRGTPVEERRVVREIKAALERAGLPRTVGLCELRHTGASPLYAEGLPLRQIAEISRTHRSQLHGARVIRIPGRFVS